MATVFTRIAASFALSGAVLAAPAFAADPAETAPSIAVRTNDLDLASEKGAKVLDRRVHRAANAVCPAYDPNDISTAAVANACRTTALAGARSQVDVALAKARTGSAYAANSTKAPAPGF